MNCIRCGKNFESTTANQMCGECVGIAQSTDFAKQLGMKPGWFCPKCGNVMSPSKEYCNFCKPSAGIDWGFNPPWNFCGEQAIGAPFDEYGTTLNV